MVFVVVPWGEHHTLLVPLDRGRVEYNAKVDGRGVVNEEHPFGCHDKTEARDDAVYRVGNKSDLEPKSKSAILALSDL